MREVAIRLRPRDVERALDRLLPVIPQGVRERAGGRHAELVVRGDDLPSGEELQRLLTGLHAQISERAASDDWRERRRADYVPVVVAGRVHLRPQWAPSLATGADGDAPIEITLGSGSAFGLGTHPTTRACVELLLEIDPDGPFADLGCGSGVLAILAARLGWAPVTAIDIAPASVEATGANAERNAVVVTTACADVTRPGALPEAAGIAANVPAAVHARLAPLLAARPPGMIVISGFGAGAAAGVIAGYSAIGLSPESRRDDAGWTVVRLRS